MEEDTTPRIQPVFAEKTIFQTGIPREGIISLIVIYSPGVFVNTNEIINLATSTMKTSDSVRRRSSKCTILDFSLTFFLPSALRMIFSARINDSYVKIFILRLRGMKGDADSYDSCGHPEFQHHLLL